MGELRTIIVSALIGAVVSFVGTLLTYFLGTRTRRDENLRQKRAEAYKDLWMLTGLLPLCPRSLDVTYKNLLDLSQDFKNWYFTQGGLYLSEESRSAYGDLQSEVTRVVGDRTNSQLTNLISDEEYDIIQATANALRKQLTTDLLSRSRVFLLR